MTSGERGAELSTAQLELLDSWMPGVRVVRDHSWGLVATVVLEVEHCGQHFIVKAGGADDHHIARELRAHREWLSPWTRRGRAPVLVHGDADAKLLVATFLPGELVEGTAHEQHPGTYEQAGALLARFHQQLSVRDNDHERRENEKVLALLDRPHRIAADERERLRAEIAAWPTPATTLVPTHGDWQPRNWLHHLGEIRIIDFGRAALRPAMSDLTRLAAQQFQRHPALDEAFVAGYGRDPRHDEAAWHRTRVREAVATAVWAHQVGDKAFEAQGHRMIAAAFGPVG